MTGGIFATPPVPQCLCTKAFQKKTGGWEVKMRKNYFLGNDITIGTIKYVKRSKVMIRLDRNAVIAQDSNLFAFVVKRRKNHG